MTMNAREARDYVRNLRRGDLVAIRTWSLGDYLGYGYVERRGITSVTLSDGRQYRGDDGIAFNAQAHGTLITFPSDKVRGKLGEPPPCDVMTRERSNRLKKIERELKKQFTPSEKEVKDEQIEEADAKSNKKSRNSKSKKKRRKSRKGKR